MDVIQRQAQPGVKPGRGRSDGDALHFLLAGLLLALVLTAGQSKWVIVEWLVGPPPQDLIAMRTSDLIDRFCCLPDPTVEEIRAYVPSGIALPPGVEIDRPALERIAAATGTYVRAANSVGSKVGLIGTVLGLLVLGLVASRVGYRFRDLFMFFIPVYGFMFIGQMAWRITSPIPYWERPPRPTFARFFGHLLGVLTIAVGLIALSMWLSQHT